MITFKQIARTISIICGAMFLSYEASAQCNNLTLCTSYDINLPVNINNTSTMPALTVLGGRIGFGTTTPQAGIDFAMTGADSSILLPRGVTSNRPTGTPGMIRFNSDIDNLEYYKSTGWQAVGSGSGGPAPTGANQQLSNVNNVSLSDSLYPGNAYVGLGEMSRPFLNLHVGGIIGHGNFAIMNTVTGGSISFGDVYQFWPVRLVNVAHPINPHDVATKFSSEGYSAAVSANWAIAAPTTKQEAIDRMAALLVTLNGGNPIP